MLFINKGEDYRTHEILTREEAEAKYGPFPKSNATPESRALRAIRESKHVYMIEMAEMLTVYTGEPWSVVDVSSVEMGNPPPNGYPGTIENMKALWEEVLR